MRAGHDHDGHRSRGRTRCCGPGSGSRTVAGRRRPRRRPPRGTHQYPVRARLGVRPPTRRSHGRSGACARCVRTSGLPPGKRSPSSVGCCAATACSPSPARIGAVRTSTRGTTTSRRPCRGITCCVDVRAAIRSWAVRYRSWCSTPGTWTWRWSPPTAWTWPYDQLARYVGTRIEAALSDTESAVGADGKHDDQLWRAARAAGRWATREGAFTQRWVEVTARAPGPLDAAASPGTAGRAVPTSGGHDR